jgi:hypothetical protein
MGRGSRELPKARRVWLTNSRPERPATFLHPPVRGGTLPVRCHLPERGCHTRRARRDWAGGDRQLQELLLGYLQAAHAPLWPGVDGLTVREVLLSYPENAAAGRVPGLQELLRRHPDLRGALVAFFADQNRPGRRSEH